MARWRVVSDTGRSDLSSEGGFVPVRDITFELIDSGRRGTVTVALRNYTPELVQAEIDRYASLIESIASLEG